MRNDILYKIFPLLSVLLYFYYDVFHSIITLIIGTLLLIPYFIRYCTKEKVHPIIWYFFICVTIGSFLNLITTENGIGGSIIFWGSYALALFTLNNLRLMQYIVLSIGFLLLYFLFFQIFIIGVRVDEIFEAVGLSRNYPGCLLVQISCFWGMAKYINYKVLPLLFPIAAVVFSFFLDGRSSLGIMIMVASFCLFFRSKKHFLYIAGVSLALLLYYQSFLLESLETTRLFKEGSDSIRYLMWESYIINLDFSSLFLGIETKHLPILRDYGGNPHNSFLNFHYRMGILGLLALIYLLIISLRNLWRSRQKEIAILIILLWARLYFDTSIISATDFIVFSMMFYPFHAQKMKQQLQQKNQNKIPNNKFIRAFNFIKIQIIKWI